MNPFFKRTNVSRRRLRFVIPALLLAATAFAGDPPPTPNIQAAEQAIANAERVDAATLAGVELGEARGKLAAAHTAVEAKKMMVAAQYADEARVEAELAAARCGAAKAKTVNDNLERSTATLIEEMQRKT